MRHSRLPEIPAKDADPSHFSGQARRHDLIAIDEPPSSALLVRFEPGGRTHWHRHPAGQYLYVMEGRGVAQSRGAEPVELAPGDCLYAAPGEEHWHGAAADEGLAHLAFSFGVTEWGGAAESD